MKLFQFAVIYHPSKEEKGERAKLILEVTTVLAKDEQAAVLQAARKIPEEYADKLDRVEVAVRPF